MNAFLSRTGSDLSSRIKLSLIIGSLCVAVIIGILVLTGVYQTQNHPIASAAPAGPGAVVRPGPGSFVSPDQALASRWLAIDQAYRERYSSSVQQAQVISAQFLRSEALDRRYGLTGSPSPIDAAVAHWSAVNDAYRARYGARMDQAEADFAAFIRSQGLNKRYGLSRP